ncbi:aldose 1-epimerase family protein, partial [Dysgonomonas sp. OttesenSCG-928-M03]|nr:aldose 1-epimerase family protein [Dysgonomonas sp. OttesenSCG-928-M03]
METLYNELLTVKVSSLGAELSSISNNNTKQEYLWQADPAFWKRHSPVLFPIVGGLRNNEYRNNGIPYTMTQHGFARDMNFELLYNKPEEVFYQLESNSETLSKYPFPFLLKIGYRLIENKIEVLWEVQNTGVSTMYFQIGAHPA